MESTSGGTVARAVSAVLLLAAITCALGPAVIHAQGLTGALVGTVKDATGGVLTGATVRVTSAVLIGGPAIQLADDRGQFRFPALPPGTYALEIGYPGFTAIREQDIRIAVGATIERLIALNPAGP